jgi:hypothetical protein
MLDGLVQKGYNPQNSLRSALGCPLATEPEGFQDLVQEGRIVLKEVTGAAYARPFLEPILQRLAIQAVSPLVSTFFPRRIVNERRVQSVLNIRKCQAESTVRPLQPSSFDGFLSVVCRLSEVLGGVFVHVTH